MRVLVIKGVSQYDGTRLFADSATDALVRAGHEPEVLDLQGATDPRALLHAHAQGCEADLVFTISILGEYRDPEGRSLSQAYAAPHVLWHVDYVLGQAPRINATPPDTGLMTIDPTHIDGLTAMVGDRFKHVRFFPHPGVGDPAPDDEDVNAFVANRPIELLWSGTYQKPVEWVGVPPHLMRPLREALDIALTSHFVPPHEAVIQACLARGIDITSPAQRGDLRWAAYVDDTVRKTRRIEFMRAVAKTGLPVHICGLGWEPHLYRFKNATYHGAVTMTRMVELMRQSRIVLNTNINFGAGSHERVFSAALAGAAAFSDSSLYYENAFSAGESELFRWTDLPGAMAALKALAKDPARCFEMGRAAKARAIAEHSWGQRIEQVLAFAKDVGRG